ncbi:MAG: iron-containing alcohol dehydrogenase [Methylotetracoccus sp.]
MKAFQIKPVIHAYDSFAEFIADANPGPTDCIFTVRHLHASWLAPRDLKSPVLLFDDYGTGEPTDELIDRLLADFRRLSCSRVIAIGGGSVLDIGKLLALSPIDAPVSELFFSSVQPVKDRELILVPTTCGTGSEMTCISIAGIPSRNTKKGLANPALFADSAALVPELLFGLPREVLITSSVDALTHALESFVAPRAHPHSELFSLEAIRLILSAHQILLKEPADAARLIARDLLTASNYAGIAFGNVGVGAVHALAYPLGQSCHVFHGEACARFLSAVFALYRRRDPQGKISRLTVALTETLGCHDGECPWERMDALLNALLPLKPLRDYGMSEADIEAFADSVVREQQRLLVNDYVDLSRDEIRDIYKQLW